MKSKSVCASLPAPRWFVLLALGFMTFLLLALISQTISRRQDSRDGFSQASVALTYVYMDGCGHCKTFSKTWSDFTTRYNEALGAAGVDTRKIRNDNADAVALNINGYPTIVLITLNGSSPPITFTGSRSVQSLSKFVSDHVPAFVP